MSRRCSVVVAKANGRNFTRKVMNMFVEALGLKESDLRITVGYEQGVDIKAIEDVKEILCLGIECKNHERLNIFTAIEQAVKNYEKEGYKEPAVVFKKGGQKGPQKTWICVDLGHYLELRRKVMENENNG